MLNLASNFLLILVLVGWTGSCLKRPEGRPPRLNNTGGDLDGSVTCASLDAAARAVHTKCRNNTPNPNETPDPSKPTEPESPTDPNDGNNTSTPGTDNEETTVEPIANNTALADISVSVDCGAESYGCLYHDSSKKYWLQCEIKGGGCGNGLHYRHETDKGAVFKNNRNSVCRDGNKTVADLAAGQIKLECKTDEAVPISFAPKNKKLTLNKTHLENQHICVVTDAGPGKGNIIPFKEAAFKIHAGACNTPDNRIKFQTQLSFSW